MRSWTQFFFFTKICQKVLNPEDVPQLCIKVLKVVNSHEEEMAGCCSDEDMDDLDKKDDDDDEEEVKFYLFFFFKYNLVFYQHFWISVNQIRKPSSWKVEN
jgi:hypothetical protein